MKRSISLLALTLLFAAVDTSEACSCVSNGPACQAVWKADSVFIGLVIAIEPLASAPAPIEQPEGQELSGVTVRERFPLAPTVRIRVQVLQLFHGSPGQEVSFVGGGACSFGFTTGETYLIYASRNTATGDWVTGVCLGTRRLDRAAADLAYLREVARRPPSAVGTISGTARRTDTGAGGEMTDTPLPGVRVVAESKGTRYEGVTGRDGKYEIKAPPGRYGITFEVPEGLWAVPVGTVQAELRDVRGCAVMDARMQYDGRIGGRIVDPDGNPVRGLDVDAFRQHGVVAAAAAVTDAHGMFELTRLGPGDYVIQTTPSVRSPRGAAAEATTVTLAASQRIFLPDVVLPTARDIAVLEGTVSDASGRPMGGVSVQLFRPGIDSRRPVGARRVTSPDGRFQVAAAKGVTYMLSADDGPRLGVRTVESEPFELMTDMTIELHFGPVTRNRP